MMAIRFAITPNEELRRERPSEQGPSKGALAPTREGAREWLKDETHNGLRQEVTMQMERVKSARACILRTKAQWPEVSTKRYDELNELHHFPTNRSWEEKGACRTKKKCFAASPDGI